MKIPKDIERKCLELAGVPPAPAGRLPYVVLPVPPSTNNLFLSVGRRRVKTPQYRAWIAEADPIAARLQPPPGTPFGVSITVYGHGRLNTARDLANCEKAIVDSLVRTGVIPGDSIRDGLWRVVLNYQPGSDGTPVAVVTLLKPEEVRT